MATSVFFGSHDSAANTLTLLIKASTTVHFPMHEILKGIKQLM